MRLSLGYPSRFAEKMLLQQNSRHALIASLAHIFTETEILDLQQLVTEIHVSDTGLDYFTRLSRRNP